MLNPTEKAAASRIITILDRHTLALKLTGAYAAESRRTLESIASELEAEVRTERIELQENSRHNAVQLAFYQSTKQLPDDALTLFTLLAVFRTTDIGRNAVLDVAKTVGIKHVSEHLDLLVNRALVDTRLDDRIPIPADRDRLTLHPILHVFAEDLFSRLDDLQRFVARHAAAEYYAEYVNFVSDRWLASDEANIIGALEWAHENNEHELVAILCDGLRSFWHKRGRARTTNRFLLWGKEAAEQIAQSTDNHDHQLRAVRLSHSYGVALTATRQLDEAERVFTESLKLQRQMGSRRGEGLVLTNLGLIGQARGKLSEAMHYFQQALQISNAEDDEQGQAVNLMYLGQVAQALGQISKAEVYFVQARPLFQKVKDLQGEGSNLASLAQVEQARGHWREAEALFQQSLSIRRESDDIAGEAVVLSLLGQLCLARGDLVETERYLRTSLALRREIDDRYGEASDLCQFGRLFLDRGDLKQSKQYFDESLTLFRDLHARADEAVVLSQLALVAIERRQYDKATELLEHSLSIRQEVQDPRGEGVDRALLGRIALEQKELDKAELLYNRSLEIARTIGNRRGEGVNLRQLGMIAERRQQFKLAEQYYRDGLRIAQEVENGLDIADISLALGSLLCEYPSDANGGCAFLFDALEIYARMQVPGEQQVRSAIHRFGCVR